MTAEAAANAPAPAWINESRLPGAGFFAVSPAAQRLLADGSWMIARSEALGIESFRYDGAGNLLSTARIPLNSYKALSIDAFGNLYALVGAGNFWLMKYDGISGHALWSSPAIFQNDGGFFQEAVALAVDGHGDVITIGDVGPPGNADWATLKFDGRTGALIWGPEMLDGAAHANDKPVAVALDSAGNVVVTGSSTTSGFYTDILTIKYSGATGATLWGPVALVDAAHNIGTPVALAVDGNGGIVISGNAYDNSAATSEFVTLKYDGATGAKAWGPVFYDGAGGGGEPNYVVASTLDPTGNVFVTGVTNAWTDPTWATLKYDGATGSLLWGPAIIVNAGTASNLPGTLAADSAGDLYFGGQVGGDFATVKYDGRTGSVVWGPNIFGPPVAPFPPGMIVVNASGDLLAAISPSGGVSTLAIVKYSGPNGATVWGPILQPNDEGGDADLTGMATDSAGSVFVTGSSPSGATSGSWKLAAGTGAPLWGPITLSNATALATAADNNGDLLVVFDRLVGNDVQALTVKYQGTTGAVLWGPIVLTLPNTGYVPLAVGADAAGDVIVSGVFSQNSVSNVFAVKYNGITGAVLWGPTLTGSFPAYSEPSFFQRIDGSGNIVIFTDGFQSIDPHTLDSFLTVKLSGATGAVLWGPVNFVSDTYAFPSSLEIDSAGNAFVAGHAYHGSSIGFVLLKYASATGAVLWGPVYYQDANSLVRPLLAVDASGDVFESGYGDYPGYELVTLKYSGASGAILWGPKVYTGLPGSAPYPVALAVNPANNLVVAGTASAANRDYLLLGYSGSDGSFLWSPVQTDSGDDDRLGFLRLIGADPVVSGARGFGTLRTIRYTLGLAIQTPAGEIPPATCGVPYASSLTAVNGTPPYSWTIASGGLPAGLSLSSSGAISGTTHAEGIFAFRARVTDSSAAFVETDFTLTVTDAGSFVPILATATAICPGQNVMLSVAGSYAAYHWLPGGETSPTITVSPTQSTDYGVVLTDATGCLVRGSTRLTVGARGVTIQKPTCVTAGGRGYAASIPDQGGGASYSWSIANGSITSGAATPAIVFSASQPGPVLLSVSAVDGTGCPLTGEAPVPQCTEAFYTLTPCRVVDTRNPAGPTGGPALAAHANRSFVLAGHCGIPANARSVSANLTITQPTNDGDLREYPGGGTLPKTSVLNYQPGQTRANNAILSLGPGGDVVIHCDQAGGTVHFILDVNGYFQ